MRRRHGYTLVELLVVAVLAVSLLGLSVAGYRTWIKSTATDASATILLAELERARAHALARCCATRVTIFDDARGDLLLVERLDQEKGEEWYPISRTNRLEWTRVQPLRHGLAAQAFYFRPDGSCCIDEEKLGDEADFSQYCIRLQSYPADTRTTAGQLEPRTIFLNARTGLANTADIAEKKGTKQ